MDIRDLTPATRRAVRNTHDLLHSACEMLDSMREDMQKMNAGIDALAVRVQELYERVEQADTGINSNIDFKYHQMFEPFVKGMDARTQTMLWELYRNEGEDLEDAKRRLFSSLSPATGPLRAFQLGCAQLLKEFDELCSANDIRYWAAFGTAIGAVRHQGFIPWDDDLDVCMMRDEIDRLKAVVAGDSRYRVTTAFDPNGLCRQIRFGYSDGRIPCFIDLFICDYACSGSSLLYERQLELRDTMIAELKQQSFFDMWKAGGFLLEDAEGADEVRAVFDRYVSLVREEGITTEPKDAQAIIYSIDNHNTQKTIRVFDLDRVFPTRLASFEMMQLRLPQDCERMLAEEYGDIFELPSDIGVHFEHVDRALFGDEMVEAVKARMEQDADETR